MIVIDPARVVGLSTPDSAEAAQSAAIGTLIETAVAYSDDATDSFRLLVLAVANFAEGCATSDDRENALTAAIALLREWRDSEPARARVDRTLRRLAPELGSNPPADWQERLLARVDSKEPK